MRIAVRVTKARTDGTLVFDGPERFASEHSRREVTQRNREERGDESRFDLALRGVGERGPRRGERARGVRDVVGEALMGVDATTAL